LNIPHSGKTVAYQQAGRKLFLDIVHQFLQPEEHFETVHGIQKPKKDAKIIVYCKTGRRGEMAQVLSNLRLLF